MAVVEGRRWQGHLSGHLTAVCQTATGRRISGGSRARNHKTTMVGVDVGIRHLAVLSTGA
jgi:transposase